MICNVLSNEILHGASRCKQAKSKGLLVQTVVEDPAPCLDNALLAPTTEEDLSSTGDGVENFGLKRGNDGRLEIN